MKHFIVEAKNEMNGCWCFWARFNCFPHRNLTIASLSEHGARHNAIREQKNAGRCFGTRDRTAETRIREVTA